MLSRNFSPISTLALLAYCAMIGGCGTIANSSREEVSIMVKPADATITVDSIYHAVGFFRSNMSRGSTHIIEVSKEGYRTARIQTGNNMSAWYIGNLYSWSILGMPVDIASGGAFTIKPNPIFVELTKGTGSAVEEKSYLDGYAQAILPIALLIALEVWLITSFSQ